MQPKAHERGSHDKVSAAGLQGDGLLPGQEAREPQSRAARKARAPARARGLQGAAAGRAGRALRAMSVRTVKSICLVGVADVAYRVFLRGYVRRQVGAEAGATH